MAGQDTSMGSGGREFPPTEWSQLLQSSEEPAKQRARLEQLCQRYWKPIYCFVRRAWRKENEEAKDLTQAFFAWLVSGEVLQRYDPARGSLRGYLKGLLRMFVRNEEEARKALKRGGGRAHLPLGELGELAAPTDESPEEAFDRVWVEDLVDRATTAVRSACEAEGQPVRIRVFEAYEMPSPGVLPTYASVAEEVGISVAMVRKHLFVVREQIRNAIRWELRETVTDVAQLEAEWKALFV